MPTNCVPTAPSRKGGRGPRATTCTSKFGPEQCFSRPGGPLQGLTGQTRETKRKELLNELFARSPGTNARGRAEPKAAAKAAAAETEAAPEAKAVKAKAVKAKAEAKAN